MLANNGDQMFNTESRLSFLCASILAGYPDKSFYANLSLLLNDPEIITSCSAVDNELWNSIEKELVVLMESNNFEQLASDYIDIFDRGQSKNSPYESDYGQNQAMTKGIELADLAGFYRAFGLDRDGEGLIKEMPDHISIELEFYAYLLMKQDVLAQENDLVGSETVYEARKKFLFDHLGRFSALVATRPGVISHPIYSKIFKWCDQLVKSECEMLEISPLPVTFFGSGDSDELKCGSIGNLLKI